VPQIDFPLHEGQAEVFTGRKRRTVLVAGRRWGKSELCAALLVYLAMQSAGRFAYIAPSYRMAKRIQWDKVLRWATMTGLDFEVNRSDLEVKFKHSGGRICLFGADNPDSLRGMGLNFVVLDEYEMFKEGLWDAVIRPTLADTRGEAVFIGTPDGFGPLYELWKRAEEGAEGWASYHFRSIDNPLLDAEEIEEARRTTDPRLFRQEWEASFEAPSGRVYDDFSREHNVRPCPMEPGLPVLVGLDFNVDPMSLVVAQQHGRELWVVGELEQRNSHTLRVAEWLRERHPAAEIWCDPAGNARQHNMGDSDVAVLKRYGFMPRFRTVTRESNKFNAVRAFVLNAAGERRLFIDPSCRRLIERMEQLAYEDADDHLTDALGYLIHGKYGLQTRIEG
jgi:hypothetical protein